MARDLWQSEVPVDNVFGVSAAGQVRTMQRQNLGLPYLYEGPAGLLSLNALSK